MEDLYAVLGLKPKATHEEVSDAYRKLARKYHPDSTKEKDLEEAVARFKEIVRAYETLGDKEKKAKYDSIYTPQKSKPKPKVKKDPGKDEPPLRTATPTPPTHDLWGRKLTPEERAQWLRNTTSDIMFEARNPPKKTMTNDPWFKDVFEEYEPPPPIRKRKPRPDPYIDTFIDAYKDQYAKPLKPEKHEDPYSEEFYQKYGVGNF